MANRSHSLSTDEPGAEQFTLRTGAKALVTSDANVLLVREQHADGSPFWTLPGGGVHPHEDPVEALHRELSEELHCEASIGSPMTQFYYAHDSLEDTVSVYTVFECSLLSDPTPNADEGVFETRWACPNDLPAATLPQVQHICQQELELPAAATADD